jgi:aminoacrylate hydrolase
VTVSEARITGGTLCFERLGAGPALLLISGLGGLAAFWRPAAALLAAHFTVIAYDHRGVGRSRADTLPRSIEEMAADATALLDSLGIRRATLIGHSTGGAIAQILAATAPERVTSLVLSSSWGVPDEYLTQLFSCRREILRRAGYELYETLGRLLLYPAEWISTHGRTLPPTAAKPDTETILGRIDALLAFDGAPCHPRISCPTLVTCARDDVVTPHHLSRRLAEVIADAKLCLFESGGHYIPSVNPGLFVETVLHFLRPPEDTFSAVAAAGRPVRQ